MPKKNLLDRAINFFSPKWANSREYMRTVGGYEGGSTTSSIFQEFLTTTTDADSSVGWDADRIIARSRDNIRNVPVASAIVNRTCDHSIGDRGLRCHPQIDAAVLGMSDEQKTAWQEKTNGEWLRFTESEESDFQRTITFPEKTYLTLKSELEGGDCFTLFINKKRPGSDFNLKLQTVEGEYCSNPDRRTNTNQLYRGVQKDSEGVPVAYHFSKYHPGDKLSKTASNVWAQRQIFSRNGDRLVLHHYDKGRPGQTRGVPVLGPVTGKLLQLGRLSKAELMASVINSYYAIVVQGKPADTQPVLKNPEESETLGDDDKFKLGTGTIARVKPGTDFKSFDPSRPNTNYKPFFEAMVAEIGAAIGVPRSLILMSFDKSYSASRGEVLLAWVFFLAKRTHIAVNLCQPTYERWLDEAVATGKIAAPGYFNSLIIRKAYRGSAYEQWTGPTRPAFNELQEAKANEANHKMGVKSLTEITSALTGREWKKVNDQINQENKIKSPDVEQTVELELKRQAELRGE